ncbi:hypothetical protein SG34_013820 [Thalassomonas viridans]|uniref:Uncharacterized protein n=1 Tax=Thalassomonas viridans TaxID=137584 RepID=A0AAF0CC53_9GAMM|nr:hypothetical protein [Thalassomonas viridans]WDE07861.1 hypothetical protein SG34_013820 [Thalassomonas viridans]
MAQSIQQKINENKLRFLKELRDEREQENKAGEVPKAVNEKCGISEEDDREY